MGGWGRVRDAPVLARAGESNSRPIHPNANGRTTQLFLSFPYRLVTLTVGILNASCDEPLRAEEADQ
jgi:hypothetical protein